VLVGIEIRAARDAHHDGDEGRDQEEENAPYRPESAPLALGLAVALDRAQRAGREDWPPVAVDDCDPADSSLQSGSHRKERERLAASTATIVDDVTATS